MSTGAGQAALIARVERAFGPDASAIVYGPGSRQEILKSLRSWRAHSQFRTPQVWSGDIIHQLSVPGQDRLFSVASQISPNGSPGLEDLALLDVSDPSQSLLVIAVESGSKLTIYRRLFTGAP